MGNNLRGPPNVQRIDRFAPSSRWVPGKCQIGERRNRLKCSSLSFIQAVQSATVRTTQNLGFERPQKIKARRQKAQAPFNSLSQLFQWHCKGHSVYFSIPTGISSTYRSF
jgi:hypothetical protein